MKMKVKYENVGAIKKGEISITKNLLNVKYGMNGVGKSTISKGLSLKISGNGLEELTTHGSDESPVVELSEPIGNVLVFNEEYIADKLFKEDVMNNSFEIVINTKEYREKTQKIESLITEAMLKIREVNFASVTSKLSGFINNFPVEKDPKKSANIYSVKGSTKLQRGRKVSNIKDNIEPIIANYSKVLTRLNNHEWLTWFGKGYEFVNDNECPYCISTLPDNFSEIEKVLKDKFKSPTLKQYVGSKEIVSNISPFVDDNMSSILVEVVNSDHDLPQDILEGIFTLVETFQNELDKIITLQNLNAEKFKQMQEQKSLKDFLSDNKLNLNLYGKLDDSVLNGIIKVNESIEDIIKKDSELSALTDDFTKHITEIVSNNEKYINDFLKIAGIPYYVKIESVNEKYKTIIVPTKQINQVDGLCLSYGEKNALSLVLFSLEAENYELIILDDPVSSFDSNKKYAIMYYLFSSDDAIFAKKTVLLLTHDFELVVDLHFKNQLKRLDRKAHYILSSDNELNEIEISKQKIKSTLARWECKVKDEKLSKVIRVVNLRKLLQYSGDRNHHAIDILSSLTHTDEEPMRLSESNTKVSIPEKQVKKGTEIIKKYFSDFDYDTYLQHFLDIEKLKNAYQSSSSSIEKLQLLRVLVTLSKKNVESIVFFDFLTMHYHVENNEMMSLDDNDYDLIPNYIMELADNLVNDIS